MNVLIDECAKGASFLSEKRKLLKWESVSCSSLNQNKRGQKVIAFHVYSPSVDLPCLVDLSLWPCVLPRVQHLILEPTE